MFAVFFFVVFLDLFVPSLNVVSRVRSLEGFHPFILEARGSPREEGEEEEGDRE